jgi:hypothetical protein
MDRADLQLLCFARPAVARDRASAIDLALARLLGWFQGAEIAASRARVRSADFRSRRAT